MDDFRLPSLLIPTEEAENQIGERIRKGEQLKRITIIGYGFCVDKIWGFMWVLC